MRRLAWLAPALLLLGACVPDVDVAHDAAMSGHLTVKTFRVRPGVVVSADSDLVIDSRGPAIIEGLVRGEVGSGASIEVRVSSGDCVIDGSLEAGSGADGEEPGEDGGAGGSVRLRADRGTVRVRAALAAAEGGEGAGRREQGRGELRAASGAGGAGGDVELVGEFVLVESSVAAGDGGAGGAAFAEQVELAPGAPIIVDRGVSPADQEEDGVEDAPLPAAGIASALAKAGGNGGSVLVHAGAGRGPVLAPGVSLRAGAGGATSRASARGGSAASAALEKPGAGGDVSVRWRGPAASSGTWDLVPGAGGDAGVLGAVSGEAHARLAAGAATAGGGEPGKVVVGGVVVKAGDGGDGGNVLAQTEQEAKYAFGGQGIRGAAGTPAAARAP
jgi:hypothetical protein